MSVDTTLNPVTPPLLPFLHHPPLPRPTVLGTHIFAPQQPPINHHKIRSTTSSLKTQASPILLPPPLNTLGAPALVQVQSWHVLHEEVPDCSLGCPAQQCPPCEPEPVEGEGQHVTGELKGLATAISCLGTIPVKGKRASSR